MATTRPFAFNTGSTISGTEQIGNLAIGENNRDYSGDYGGVRWWMGPDEDLGYVIAQPRSSNDQPTQPGIVPPFGSVGFWRTVGFLDSSFIQLSEYVSDKSGFPQTFNTGAEAKTWLNDNGYWTSYIESPITPTPTPTVTSTNTQTPTPTNTQTPTPTNTQTPTPTNTQTPTPTGVNQLIDPIIVGFDEYLGVGVDEYLMFVDPVTPGVSPTPTQTPTNTPTQTPTNTPTQTPTNTSTQTPTQTSTNTPTPSVTPTSSEIPVTPTPTSTPTPTPSSAPFSVTMIESGGNVVLSFAGALDLTGLNFVQNQQVNGGGVGASQAAFGIGPATLQNVSLYTGATFSYPSNFGPGGGGPGGSVTGSGDYFGVFVGILPTNCIVVPTGYTSNTYIAGTTTLGSSTFSSLGMSAGTYNYSWGAGPGQSFVLTIGGIAPTPTPTPSSGATPSGFTVTIQEVGPDVVWSGSGSLNLNDLTLQNTQTIAAGYAANQAIWAAGPITPTNAELWSGPSFTTYPTSFGSGGTAPTSSTGSIFGILPGGSGRTIIVPSGYVSGSLLNGTTTYDNTTILDMGLTPGTYVWSWGTGPNADSITMIIG